MSQAWKKCSSCKSDILLGQNYYICSVSTCQAKATNYVFCSVGCWEAHVPVERHRGDGAGALERKAPLTLTEEATTPARIVPTAKTKSLADDEVLVVVTKVRKYIADRSGLNTSAEVYDTLTEKIKRLCDQAIEHAKSQGRKTVMSRDFT